MPTEHGGLGLGYLHHCIAMEELSRASGSGAGAAAVLLACCGAWLHWEGLSELSRCAAELHDEPLHAVGCCLDGMLYCC